MIAYLQGKIKVKGRGYIILIVNNVGYKVHVNPTMLADLSAQKDLSVFIYQQVKEDTLDLYGFKTMDELEMFELLLSISGIGPKSALGVLAISSIDDIKETIIQGDSSLLTKVSGIGKKTAERIVLELREKVASLYPGSESGESTSGASVSGDEIDALMALGYSMMQAREALKKVKPDIKDSSQRIKEALKSLGK